MLIADDPNGCVHPDWAKRERDGRHRFTLYIYEHNPDEEAGWKYKLTLTDHKFSDSDTSPIQSIPHGDSWREAFDMAGRWIEQALAADHCIF